MNLQELDSAFEVVMKLVDTCGKVRIEFFNNSSKVFKFYVFIINFN